MNNNINFNQRDTPSKSNTENIKPIHSDTIQNTDSKQNSQIQSLGTTAYNSQYINADSQKSVSFIYDYFFHPNLAHKVLSICLLPFSLLYFIIAIIRKKCSTKIHFGIKIISIGNLVSGGSGKTPFCIALVKFLDKQGCKNIGIILRGYKRESKGLLCVSKQGNIMCDVMDSGDEAMLIALETSYTKSNVFVSENRKKAIIHAKNMGITTILLDDGYRFNFVKLDILLEPIITPYFNWVLPSGYYRFPPRFYAQCDIHVKEGQEYHRITTLHQPQYTNYSAHNDMDNSCVSKLPISNMTFHIQSNQCKIHKNLVFSELKSSITYILATAIANPQRLDSHIPYKISKQILYKYYLHDHANFDESVLAFLLQKYKATHILMTQKDIVKCSNFSLPIHILTLDVHICKNVLQKILDYLQD